MARELFQSHLTELERIEPEANAFCSYHIALWLDLFGGVSLVREWGRIGQSSCLELEPYPNAAAAKQAFQRLVRLCARWLSSRIGRSINPSFDQQGAAISLAGFAIYLSYYIISLLT